LQRFAVFQLSQKYRKKIEREEREQKERSRVRERDLE
jgi:hypothetical protein